MKIITYNIWDLPLWFVRNRTERLKKIGEYVIAEGADIVCFQESWNLKNRTVISAYMREHGYHDAVAQAGIRRSNGGLLTFSKFPITSVRFISFGRTALSVSEFIGNKGVLETVIDTPQGLMKVLNVHLHYESSRLINTAKMRLRQLRKLFSVLEHDADTTMPIILAGDFNQPDMQNNKLFSQLFSQAGFMFPVENTVATPTYRQNNPLVDNWLNRIRESKVYDYILIKGIASAPFSIKDYHVHHLDAPLSDHDPVVLMLE